MNKGILVLAGFGRFVALIEKGICPSCEKPIVDADFRDELSRKEFKISGLCQKCQDSIFSTKNNKEKK